MSTPTQSIQRIGRRLALLAGVAAATLGLGVSTALAQSIEVSPSENLSATAPTEVSVTGSGFAASGEYRVGLCSTESYGMFGIPACGQTVPVTANETGAIATTVTVEKTTDNVHADLMFPLNVGQPEEFTCAGDPEVDDQCEVWTVDHDETQVVEAAAPVSFE